MAQDKPELTVGLYGNGLFGRDVPNVNQSQLLQLQESGFTRVILWTLHVDPDGSLIYNNTPIVQNGDFANTFNYLPALLTKLASTGSVKEVLFSIGSWGVDDFENIQALLKTQQGTRALRRNFSALAAALPLSGFDFDDESLYDPATTAQLTEMLCAGNTMMITYCPYTNQQAWNSALQQTYTWDQQQNPPLGQSVAQWHLQCYAGGAGNDPLTWAKNLPANAGIHNAPAFILPGFDSSQSPSSIQSTFAKYKGTGITGGFIWNSSQIFASSCKPREYAQAIIDGLLGVADTAGERAA